jgi:hypothetical protein
MHNCLKMVKGCSMCKRWVPFDLASRDWIDKGGEWGPKRLVPYLNNWNPAILQCLHANHDIKFITNGAEMNNISWYITCYTAKQHVSLNRLALLMKRLAFHKRQEAKIMDIRLINKKLIQRCANTLSREQDFSAPEVIGYLKGWGDCYISQHFVSIYWDAVMLALKRTYLELRFKK